MASNYESGSAKDSLEDNTVKLIAYTIVSLKRDKEQIMEGGQKSVIVTDSMTGEAFSSMILARYLQEEVVVPFALGREGKMSRMELLKRNRDWEQEDLKYLRVYYVVSTRWPREPLDFEERQIDQLEQIRDRLA
jgi:hypothetical protein